MQMKEGRHEIKNRAMLYFVPSA